MSFGRFYLTFGATLFYRLFITFLSRGQAGNGSTFLSRVMQSDGYLAGLLSQFSYQFLTHQAAKIRVSSLIDKKKWRSWKETGFRYISEGLMPVDKREVYWLFSNDMYMTPLFLAHFWLGYAIAVSCS